MDVDGDEKMQEEEVQRRMIMLVAAADLDGKLDALGAQLI